VPTYTYQCKSCQENTDVFHAISAAPRIKCPLCGGACIKLIGAGAGIIFKGSGFYETDYKKSSGKTGSTPPAKPAKETVASTPTSAGSDKKTEKKAASSSSE